MKAFWPLAVACLLLTGCVEVEPPRTEPDTDSEVIQYWLDLARDETPGASDHQIEVLERALERGSVERADLTEVLPEYYDCLDAAGLTYYVDEIEPVPGSGVFLPSVSVVAPDSDEKHQDEASDLWYSCAQRHELYVASAYSNQPTSIEAEDRVWTGEAMRDCLNGRGYIVDDDATAAEIRSLYDADVVENGQVADYRPC